LNTHLLPAKTECIRYFDLPQFWGSILKHTKIVRLSLDRDEKVLLGDLENKINNRFIVQINLIKTVKNHLLSRKIMLPVYTRIIKNIRPKIAVVVVSYGYGTIIEACKDLAIPVVEFQHGNLSKYHVGYSFPEGSVSGLQFPDYLLTFGDYWKGLVKLPIPNSHIIHAGYPHFESEKAKYSGEQRKQQIIFISQGTIGKQLSSFAVKLKKIPDFSWDIVYKLHPGEYVRWRREYPWLIDSGITVMDDNSIPLYKLLAQSTFLVGVYSTVVYEGIGLGLQAILLDLPGIEYMDELIKSKLATKVSTVEELISQIEQLKCRPANSDDIFKPNAVENISKALKGIMRQRLPE